MCRVLALRQNVSGVGRAGARNVSYRNSLRWPTYKCTQLIKPNYFVFSRLNFSIYMHLPETRLCPENKHFPYFYAAIFSVVSLFKEIWHLLGIFCFSFAEKQTYEHLLCWLFYTRKMSTNYGSNIALTWRIPLSLNSVTTNFNSYSNTTLRHRNMVNFRRRKSNMSEVFISLRLGRSGY